MTRGRRSTFRVIVHNAAVQDVTFWPMRHVAVSWAFNIELVAYGARRCWSGVHRPQALTLWREFLYSSGNKRTPNQDWHKRKKNVQTAMNEQRGHNFQVMHHCVHFFLLRDSGFVDRHMNTLSNQAWRTTRKPFLKSSPEEPNFSALHRQHLRYDGLSTIMF